MLAYISQAPATAPIPSPPSDYPSAIKDESLLSLPLFTTSTAYVLGTRLRNRIRSQAHTPALISISLSSGRHLYLSTTRPGTTPNNMRWVERKRATVLRFGCSSWAMGRKFGGDEEAFGKKYGLGESAGEYAIHGGGVPVRVNGVEGVVAVVVVSGLKQEEDHMVVVEEMKTAKQYMEVSLGRDLECNEKLDGWWRGITVYYLPTMAMRLVHLHQIRSIFHVNRSIDARGDLHYVGSV